MYHLFCFGLSYCASEVINQLSLVENDKWKFSATYNSKIIKSGNIRLYDFNVLKSIPTDTSHILISIPPQAEGDIVYLKFRQQISSLKYLKWIGYLSTTGVYGNKFGGWVSEKSILKPSKYQSFLRVIAENQWLNISTDIEANIFRLSSIYGINRNDISRVLDKKLPIIIKENQYFSRIHVEDIAQILIKSFEVTGEIFNISDDYPCPSSEVTRYAYDLLNVQRPEPIKFQDVQLSDMHRAFYAESRKVDNFKIKTKLNIKLKYPTFVEGLNAILASIK